MRTVRVLLPLVTARRFLDDWFIAALLALSLALNVYLGIQLRSRPHVDISKIAMQFGAAGDAVQIGARMPTLVVQDLAGAKVTLNWMSDRRPTLIYVFSPACHWCTRNLQSAKVLANALASEYRIIWLSTTEKDVANYVKANSIASLVYVNPYDALGRRFTSGGTPRTFIISDGKVTQSWPGAYTGWVREEVETKLGLVALGVKLPQVLTN